MRVTMQALGAAIITAGIAGLGGLVCAPQAAADDETYTTDEQNYLSYLDLFADFPWFSYDEPYLLQTGHTACEEKQMGIGEDFSVNFIVAEADGALDKEDAELIYEAAMVNLC